MLVWMSLYYVMQKETEGFRIMLLIFPSTTRSEPPGFTPMSPVYSIKFPFSGANSPAALAHETDVMRVCQDGPLRPSMRQCSNNYSCIAPIVHLSHSPPHAAPPQGVPDKGYHACAVFGLERAPGILPESHVGHLSAQTNILPYNTFTDRFDLARTKAGYAPMQYQFRDIRPKVVANADTIDHAQSLLGQRHRSTTERHYVRRGKLVEPAK